MFSGYWPWWFGGPVFALVVVGFWLVERRLFGTVGQYVRVIDPPEGSDALDKASPEALDAALREATLAEFGPEAVAELEAEAAAEAAREQANAPRERAPVPRFAALMFLVMLPVGGALGALVSGTFGIRTSLGALHEQLVAGGPLGLAVLLVGGVMVGVGTRLAGGCTSGHGLSGCSRLQSGSLVATASFFGAGVAVSFLLEALKR